MHGASMGCWVAGSGELAVQDSRLGQSEHLQLRYIAILKVDCPIGRLPNARLGKSSTCQRPNLPMARPANGPTRRFPNAGIADCQMVKPPNVGMSNCPNGRTPEWPNAQLVKWPVAESWILQMPDLPKAGLVNGLTCRRPDCQMFESCVS